MFDNPNNDLNAESPSKRVAGILSPASRLNHPGPLGDMTEIPG